MKILEIGKEADYSVVKTCESCNTKIAAEYTDIISPHNYCFCPNCNDSIYFIDEEVNKMMQKYMG